MNPKRRADRVSSLCLARRAGRHARGALAGGAGGRKVFAIVVGLAGQLILSGADKWIEAHLLDLLPEARVATMTIVSARRRKKSALCRDYR